MTTNSDQRQPQNVALRARIDRFLQAHEAFQQGMNAVAQRTLAQVRETGSSVQADTPLSVAEMDAWLAQQLRAFDALKREMLARKLVQPGSVPTDRLDADELQALRQISDSA